MIGLFQCQAYLPKLFIIDTGLRRYDDFNFDFLSKLNLPLVFPVKSLIVDNKLG
jgi:hypothetical protein